MHEHRQRFIQSGYKESDRTRQATGVYVEGDDKLPIASESMRYTWAALYFFGRYMGQPLSWPELAELELQVLKVDKVTTISAAVRPGYVLTRLDAAKRDARSRANRSRMDAYEDGARKVAADKRAATKRKLEQQIRTNVTQVLHFLKLPLQLQG